MKKITAILLVVALVAIAVAGSTMAYFSDEAGAVNVTTVGNVKIEMHEYERALNADGSYKTDTIDGQTSYVLQPFTQAKPLYPATELNADGTPNNYGAGNWDATYVRMSQVGSKGGMQVFTNENAIDKFVVVTNTGKSDAYFRTIYAFEAGSKTASEWDELIGTSAFMVDQGVWTENEIGLVEIDGHNYVLVESIYNGGAHLGGVHENGVLPAGETAYLGLGQIYMKATASNEDAEALDGNGNGLYEILVWTQAVQAAGFDNAETALNAAFGDITATNHPWSNGIVQEVDNAADLASALETALPGSTIKLGAADFGTVELSGELTGVTIAGSENTAVKFNILGTAELTDVTFTNFNLTYADSSSAYVDGGAINIDAGAKVKNLVIENSVFNGTGGRSCVVGISEPSAEVTLRGCTVNGPKYLTYSSAPIAKLTVEGCEINDVSSWLVMMNAGDAVGAKLTITGNNFTNCTGGIAKYLGSTQPEGAFTVFTGNELTNCKGHDGSDAKWFTIPGAASTITVSGNTLDGADWTPGTAQGLGK